MSWHFYRLDREPGGAPPPPLPPRFELRWWQPHADGLPRRGARRPSNILWWLLAKTGRLGSDFAEIRIEAAGRLLHRLIVTPAWYRFPFMAAGDLQIGDVWTAPEARRRQLARIAIAEVHRRFGTGKRRFWYVTDEANRASAALARSFGYVLVATGRRSSPLGVRLLGRYLIERAA